MFGNADSQHSNVCCHLTDLTYILKRLSSRFVVIRSHGLAFLVPALPEPFKPQCQGGVSNIMEDFYRNTFSYILDCYKSEKFCDVRIFARPESFSKECITDESYVGGNLQSISCHSLVLASVAPALKEILLVPESLDTKNNQDVRYVRMFYALATSTGYAGRRPLPWLACNVARA